MLWMIQAINTPREQNRHRGFASGISALFVQAAGGQRTLKNFLARIRQRLKTKKVRPEEKNPARKAPAMRS
ncbi:hypothetical protein REC12_19250 [Desulfosporosinus sp. PR]|uniref:hypothetical protein n=1 Tax=Candidatus Desulfosporosinus nitrosoreducens TaxID=3401928 RepID=UPI0027F2DA77|nr:hypothetical protein [Desulfosporosinus sp. PR]MDQ7095731.1 hypothetical protein [Desulfosporosinus sp. PR]